MTVKFKFRNVDKGAWMALRQTYNLMLRCQDRVFSEHDITTERHAVLMAMKHIDDPVRPTDVARWLDLSVNSVSMIIDRMVKAGLVKRVRDRKDRRTVFLSMTSKAEKAYVLASVAGWGLIQEILSPLSDKDKRTLTRLLEILRDKTYDYLGSEGVAEEVRRAEPGNMARLMKEAAKYNSLGTPEPKRRRSSRKKATQ
jgi:DNA-binding MarR family transcriptional regulator